MRAGIVQGAGPNMERGCMWPAGCSLRTIGLGYLFKSLNLLRFKLHDIVLFNSIFDVNLSWSTDDDWREKQKHTSLNATLPWLLQTTRSLDILHLFFSDKSVASGSAGLTFSIIHQNSIYD